MGVQVEEDEIVFRENGELRVLRGTILSEDTEWVTLSRQDGTWRIRTSTVTKVRRVHRRLRP